MNIGEWLERAARARPDGWALFRGSVPLVRYRDFRDNARAVASWLISRDVMPGDRVGLYAANVPDYLVAQYAIWYAGAAVVPINAKLHEKEAAWICKNAGVSLVYSSQGLAEAVTQAEPGCDVVTLGGQIWQQSLKQPGIPPKARKPADLAWLFYTSGTTGRPKGVQITHRMLEVMSLSYLADVDSVTAQDAALYAAPLSHGAGIYNMVHVLKAARHIFPVSQGFDEAEILELAAELGDVHMFAAPTMVKRLTRYARNSGLKGEGIRTVVYAGGPMYMADILDAVAHFGPLFVQIYGQGECPMGITVLSRDEVADRRHPRWRERLASVGRAQSASQVAIADPQGRLLGPGEHGEIVVRGDIVMPGYWKNPAATKATLRDGWLWTGDMGFMDEEGYVTMQDRSKDMIISGGSNIYPREVEEVLVQHPTVSEAAVIGRMDAEWGEIVVAFVVPEQGMVIDTQLLDRHCLDGIARFKRPKEYVTVPSLPKNNYGKVLKTVLRDRLSAERQST